MSDAKERYRRLLEQWSGVHEEMRSQHGQLIDAARPYFEASKGGRPEGGKSYGNHGFFWVYLKYIDLIDYKSTFEPIIGLRHYSSWIRLFFLQFHVVDLFFAL